MAGDEERAEGSRNKPMTVVEHLEELRRRIIIIAVAEFVAVAAAFAFSKPMVSFLARPVGGLVYLTPIEAFMAHVKVAVAAGTVVALPVVLWQLIAFVTPALHRRERRHLFTLLPASVALFAGGVFFAYYGVLPFMLRFFMGFGSREVSPVISIGNYISFVIGLVIPFGVAFQLPVAVYLLTKIGVVTPAFLVRYRKFAVLGIFVTAAVITPPDVASQVFLAVPMLFLYELSVAVSKLAARGMRRNP